MRLCVKPELNWLLCLFLSRRFFVANALFNNSSADQEAYGPTVLISKCFHVRSKLLVVIAGGHGHVCIESSFNQLDLSCTCLIFFLRERFTSIPATAG